jgi:diguanylate cyclase (GGDEF)-like protein/PAS domain S-box-containing protein
MPSEERRKAASMIVPVAAFVAAGAGMLAIVADSGPASEIVAPLSVLTLLIGVLVLARVLENNRQDAAKVASGEGEARTRLILDRSHEAYVEMDSDGKVTAWNAAAETMFGWRREEAMGRELAALVVPEDMRHRHREGLVQFNQTGRGPMVGPRTEVIAVHRDGAEIPVELLVTALENPAGGYTFHGFLRDITERKLLEAQQAEMLEAAKQSARIDVLTALPNRRGWDEALGRELSRARRDKVALCMALIDLDHFKDFNDTNGHQAGDRLLRRAASAWKLAVRQYDLIARYGGEEFSVLLPACELDQAIEVIERLREVTPEGQTVSAGVAEWNGYESADALIDRTDLALYNAKRDGRDRSTAAA